MANETLSNSEKSKLSKGYEQYVELYKRREAKLKAQGRSMYSPMYSKMQYVMRLNDYRSSHPKQAHNIREMSRNIIYSQEFEITSRESARIRQQVELITKGERVLTDFEVRAGGYTMKEGYRVPKVAGELLGLSKRYDELREKGFTSTEAAAVISHEFYGSPE